MTSRTELQAGDRSEQNPKIDPAPHSNIEKEPDDRVSGGEPMTGAQASYLKQYPRSAATRKAFSPTLPKLKHRSGSTRSKQSEEPSNIGNAAMSRAFVKETEGNDALPDRPISPNRNFVTQAGLSAIGEAITRFETEHRDAVENGNAPAVAAALREVRYWRARRANAELVKPGDRGEASFGTTVTLRRRDGREQRFRIVGEDEADPARGTLSYVSPLARAVSNHRAWESFEYAGEKVLLVGV
jgi:transcription elongation GreA/GreB family factor